MRYLFLALLSRGPVHGYDLKRLHDTWFAGVWSPINIGQIYSTMGRLSRDGLVSHKTVEQDDRPDKKVYELTPLGEKALRSWLEEPSAAPTVKSDLVLKVVAARFSGLVGSAELIAVHRTQALQALRDLDELAGRLGGAPEPVRDLLIEGAALHLQAELQWLDRCAARLATKETR